ncbi:MAG: DNA alkylation repair protein [Myxococcales bacterium]|nr:DNA alkylation repair protein [Myxococcales bacterium]
MSDENPNAFKHWFGPDAIARTEAALSRVHAGFDAARFRDGLGDLGPLALKDRVRRFTEALEPAIGLPFPDAARVLVAALPPPVDPDVPNQFETWLWPLVHYVGRYGLDHPEIALEALRELTCRFSAEFDIRPYIVRYPALVLERLAEWADHPDKNVRRLVSEGTRPRLPWGERLSGFIDAPETMLPILRRLRLDPSDYVRRSVANHLGDIAKDHPALVVRTLSEWLAAADDASVRRTLDALAKHAVRHLIKAGDPGALALFGYAASAALSGTVSLTPASLPVGEAVHAELTVCNDGPEPVRCVIDYAVGYRGASGGLRRKVFKLTAVEIDAGASWRGTKRHAMKPVSIRALFPGEHSVSMQVNGVILATATFELLPG